jgi:hypothetical protein
VQSQGLRLRLFVIRAQAEIQHYKLDSRLRRKDGTPKTGVDDVIEKMGCFRKLSKNRFFRQTSRPLKASGNRVYPEISENISFFADILGMKIDSG